MPTKHIDDLTWKRVEDEAVKATISTKRPVSEREMLKFLILKGLVDMDEGDYNRIARSKSV